MRQILKLTEASAVWQTSPLAVSAISDFLLGTMGTLGPMLTAVPAPLRFAFLRLKKATLFVQNT